MSESGAPSGKVPYGRGNGGEAGPPGTRGQGEPDHLAMPDHSEPDHLAMPDHGKPAGPARPGGAGQAGGSGGPQPAGHRLPDPWGEMMHLADQVATGRAVGAVIPAWRRRTRGEYRWPVTVSVIAAIVLQVLLPDSLTAPLPHWLMPALEGALGVALTLANPVRIERRGTMVRAVAIALIVVISAANAVSAVLLIRAIVETLPATAQAGPLLASGANIWATNVIAFGLWYWEFDRGGPVRRAEGTAQHPDLMFPQLANPDLAPPDWKPHFVDYLYLSFTNATAFSPTDVMPLARWAKATMAVQSAVSLAVGALVIARAVNILK